MTLASKPLKASKTDSAAFLLSAKTTPKPCVPSSNLIITGTPPTCSITSSTSLE